MKRILLALALILCASKAAAQTETWLQLPTDASNTGKKLRMRSNTISANLVYSQGFFLEDGSGGAALGVSANPIFVNFVAGAAVTQGTAAADTAAWPMKHGVVAATTAAWTSATTVDTTVALAVTDYATVAVSLRATSTMTGGTLNFEASDDGGTNWYAISAIRVDTTTPATEKTFALSVTTNLWQVPVAGLTNFRVRLNPVITGTGTANVRVQASAAAETVKTVAAGTGWPRNVDNDVWSFAGATWGTTLFGLFDDTASNTTTEDRVGPLRETTNRALHTNLRNSAGAEIGIPAAPLRTDPTGTTAQPVTQATGTNLHVVVDTAPTTAVTNIGLTDLDATTQGVAAGTAATKSQMVGVVFNTALPTLTNGQGAAAQANAKAELIVAQPTAADLNATVTGTVTSNQGTANTNANGWFMRLTDATNNVAVKAASTAAVATDPALVVAVSPNNTIAATQSGTWTVQPGNTANTTPWLVGINNWLGSTAPTVAQKTMANSLPVVPASDYVPPDTATGSTALGALNAAISVALAGQQGAGFNLAAGTLIGTITPELSYDGGTTWVATLFYDPITTSTAQTIVYAGSNTAATRTIIAGNGVSNVRVRVSAFTSGTANATMRATASDGQLLFTSKVDGTKMSYHSSGTGQACAASATAPCFAVYGSATKVVRITRISISATAATAALEAFQVIKFSTAPSGGTSAAFTAVPLDALDAATTATSLLKYTVAPTAGTAVGAVDSFRCLAGSATVTGNCQVTFIYGDTPGARTITLRGTAQGIGIIVTVAGTVDATVEWTEE